MLHAGCLYTDLKRNEKRAMVLNKGYLLTCSDWEEEICTGSGFPDELLHVLQPVQVSALWVTRVSGDVGHVSIISHRN